MFLVKKIKNNKMLVLAVFIIVISLVYTGIQKAIDNYNFKHNNDIIVDETIEISEDTKEEFSANDDGKISNEETDLELEEQESNQEGTGTTEEAEPNKIYVYITGEINNPGVLILNEGSRIVDAINAAGGTTVRADISKVNLVYILEDGMKVNIPNKNDLKNNDNFEYITMNSGEGGREDYSKESKDEGGMESTSSGKNKKYSLVNINTATQTELETLPGIGPSLALKIINHRKENGKFSSIEQIKDVSGIGENKYENLKSYITI